MLPASVPDRGGVGCSSVHAKNRFRFQPRGKDTSLTKNVSCASESFVDFLATPNQCISSNLSCSILIAGPKGAGKGKKTIKLGEPKKAGKGGAANHKKASAKARKLPKGWKLGHRLYLSGPKQGSKYKIFIAPDGSEHDRWSKIDAYIANHK